MFIVYVLQHTISKKFYFGFTTNLKQRLEQHNQGKNTSTKRLDGEWKLVYAEAYRSKSDAIRRESKLKHHGSSKHELLKRIKDSTI